MYTFHELCDTNVTHDALRKLQKRFENVRRCGIEISGKRDQVAQVNGLDNNSSRCLTRELPLSFWVFAVSNNQDTTLLVWTFHTGCLQTPLVIFGAVEFDPANADWSRSQLDRLTTRECGTHFE